MDEFWLISAPGEPTPKKMWDHVREKTKELSASHKFGLPEIQVCFRCVCVPVNDAIVS